MSESSEAKIKRCIIYTRKSTEKGLEQSYNSLDAQRESAENYIKSQKENGWQLIPEHYDDGGYSGGNTERPALKRLMNDIKAGGIDIIIVYKLDRLSRSLLDFMNLAEFFEQHNVSVISVTQDINTSTSSGRMMLNILMTFCQFEREILVERIKDKIAGAKRRGKFCGGVPILGYDVEDKRLMINSKEAKLIREIFRTYTKLGSGFEVARILNGKGRHTKSWTSKKGKFHSGNKFIPKDVYHILNNPLYIGMVQHNGNVYEGEQEAIIDKKLWDKVQYLLQENSKCPAGENKNHIAAPFKGLLVCGYCGGSFGITYTKKKNRRYMYYICIKDNDRAEHECPLRRFAAGAIDKIILQQLSRIFKSPAMLMKTYRELEKLKKEQRAKLLKRFSELKTEQDEVCKQLRAGGDVALLTPRYTELDNALDEVKRELESIGEIYSTDNLAEACGSIESVWEELFPVERYKLAHLLIDRITLYKDRIIMDIKHHGLKSLIRDLKSEPEFTATVPEGKDTIQLTIPMLVKRWNGRKLIVAPDEGNNEVEISECEPAAMAKRLAQAHKWTEMLESGEYATVAQLADAVDCDPSKTFKILNLVNLSPAIQKIITEGNTPESMTLTKLFCEIPEDWEEQERIFL
ncbi:MAG: recombinase family protein [Victivallaceae bacterium]|nr:recombinase family protein [Victivallaceae bacterium]